MAGILSKLKGFPGKDANLPTMCSECFIDFTGRVEVAIQKTTDYFDGLCLGTTSNIFSVKILIQY